MALYKKEVLVRPNSTMDFAGAMNWTRDWLMRTFQDVAQNRDENGNYKDYFFADVFFAYGHQTNRGQIWRIYADPCEQKYGLQRAPSGRIEFLISDKEGLEARVSELEARVVQLEDENGSVKATVI